MEQRDRLIEIIQKSVGGCARNWAEIIADGLLADGWIRPPCKVGDTVYYFSHRPFNFSVQSNTIYEAKVVRIVTTSLGTQLVIQIRNEYGCTEIPDVREWGKNLFASREEAERELERRKK